MRPERAALAAAVLYLVGPAEAVVVQHAAFEPVHSDRIGYIDVTTQQFVHHRTGAELLLLEPAEGATPERLFMAAFRTPPSDDTGVPHILEHSVLSGSRKYPLKNPFFNMAETSAATFLNAMTDSDMTIYPVVTIDSQDLLNLASVYLDGIFDPLCIHDRMIFEREGWHLEYDRANHTLRYSGVVYNEMKGYYSNPSMIAFRRIAKDLFKDTIYAHSSGGDPRAIVDLKYEDYVNYYYEHYHPSNAKIMYYGSTDRLTELLDMIDEYLILAEERYAARSASQPAPEHSATSLRPGELTRVAPFPIRHDAEVIYSRQSVPASAEKELKDSVLFIVAAADVSLSLCEKMSLKFLSSLLMGTKDSPLFARLLQADYADQISPAEIFQWGHTTLFLIESSGIDPQWTCDSDDGCGELGHAYFFHNLIEKSLIEIAEEGFDLSEVEGKLNRFEFILKEAAVNQADQAFYLSQNIISKWNYDENRNPIEFTQIDKGFQCLRDSINNDENYLKNILHKYLIHNHHRMVLTLEESPSFTAELDRMESERLNDMLAELTDDQLRDIEDRAEALKTAQRKPDPPELLALLPKLKLSSLPRKALPLDYNLTEVASIPVVSVTAPMADIVYTTVLTDLPHLSYEELRYLDLLLFLLTSGDSSDYTAAQLNSLKENHMGRFSLSVETSSSHAPMTVRDPTRASLWLSLTFDCLKTQLPKCAEIVSNILLRPGLEKNQQRSAVYLKEIIVDLEDTLSAQPASFVASRLTGKLSAVGALNDFINGLPGLGRSKSLLNEVINDWDVVVKKMQRILAKLFHQDRMAARLLGDDEDIAAGAELLKILIADLTRDGSEFINPDDETAKSFSLEQGFVYHHPRWLTLSNGTSPATDMINFATPSAGFSIAYETSAMVSTNILVGAMFPAGSFKPYRLVIPARVLSSSFVLPQLRLEGGAYGASFSLNEESGMVVFQTSRDPHVFRSFEIMMKSKDEVFRIMNDVTDERIEELIIQSIFKLDRPRKQITKANLAFKRWSSQWTDTHEQIKRDLIFTVSRTDFMEFAQRLNETLSHGLLFATSAANPRHIHQWADKEATIGEGGALEPFVISPLREDRP